MQGVRNYESMNSQTVWKILFVAFQWVGLVKCQIFSVSFLEQTLLYYAKILRFFFLGGKSDLFPNFNVVNIQKIEFSWKINQNLGGRPTEREELPFLYKNLELFIFKIFAGVNPKLRKYEFSDSLKLLEELRTMFVWRHNSKKLNFQGVEKFKTKIRSFIRGWQPSDQSKLSNMFQFNFWNRQNFDR